MARISEIVHFFEQKISSVLTVDEFPPSIKQDRFVREGGFYLRIADGEGNSQTIKLSDTEMTTLIADIALALDRHRQDKFRLYAQIDRRQIRTPAEQPP